MKVSVYVHASDNMCIVTPDLCLSKLHRPFSTLVLNVSSDTNIMFITSICVRGLSKKETLQPLTALIRTSNVRRQSAGGGPEPRKTSLYDFHVQNGGKMVDFAGHLLPVQYAHLGVSASHLHTRRKASLFDVSHMLQTMIKGRDCISWFEKLCPVDLHQMENGSSALTVFLNESGGILDDLIVTKIDSENLYVVSNAGRMDHDKKHMTEFYEFAKAKGKDIHITFLDVSERSLIAVQGPKAVESFQNLCTKDLSHLYFMNSMEMKVAGVEGCRVTRCGYTGEDGVEVSIPASSAPRICEILMRSPNIRLAGLGARDSLRLEAGLCLYGNDIDDTITPVEASLTWLIAKRRREDGDFMGAGVVLKQIRDGVSKRRVGLRLESGPPARRGVAIMDLKMEGDGIGVVTSGCPSPSLGGNVAMGYVEDKYKKPGTKILVNIRNSHIECKVAKMPFVPAKYHIKK